MADGLAGKGGNATRDLNHLDLAVLGQEPSKQIGGSRMPPENGCHIMNQKIVARVWLVTSVLQHGFFGGEQLQKTGRPSNQKQTNKTNLRNGFGVVEARKRGLKVNVLPGQKRVV